MLVHGAIVPPPAALAAVDAVVRAIPVPGDPGATPAPKGLLGRLGRHRADAAEDAGRPVMLEHVPVADMRLPVTGFGNLTATDAHRVTEAIRDASAGWSPATVRLAGGTALDFPGDWSVWARLEGDLDALSAMAASVPESVAPLGFFVDRRMFRPMLSVATVTRQTTGPFLQEVVDALGAFRGEEWPVEIALLKEAVVEGRTQVVELERIGPRG